jgi:hypothetical protein
MQYRLMAACAVAAATFGTVALAQYGGGSMGGSAPTMVPHVTPRTETIYCPTAVSVVLTPSMAASGWSTNNSPVSLSPDTKNPPRVESGEMICYYAMPDGYNAFTYFQDVKGRMCTTRSDGTGFSCHS